MRVVFTGAESSGKTTLVQKCALILGGDIVEEFSRKYLSEKKNKYNYNDLLKIAKGQVELEKKHFKNHQWIDTELITIKIWSEYKYGKCDSWILDQIIQRQYDLYVLCSPENIEWEFDELRESPNNRNEIYDLYKKELIFYKKNFIEVKGTIEERFLQVKKHLQL